MAPLLLSTSSLGVSLSLITAVLWALSPLCWASAGRRIGSYPVITLRSLLATVLLLALLPVYRLLTGTAMTAPSLDQTFWLIISSLTGLIVGDILLFEALVRIGPRRGTQILTLAPVASVVLAWLYLGERLSIIPLVGIVLTLGATLYAVIATPDAAESSQRSDPGRLSAGGIMMAAIGAMLVGVGAVTTRQAFRSGPPLDAVVAATVRVGTSAVFLGIVPLVRGHGVRLVSHLRDGFVLSRVIAGTLAGPVAGMLCYVLALKHLEAGLVSTLVALSPLFILPMIVWRYGVRIRLGIIVATLAACAGVAMICLR